MSDSNPSPLDSPLSAAEHLASGKELYESKDYAAALKAFQAALQLEPQWVEALIWCGRAHHSLRQHLQAQSLLHQATQQAADDSEAWYWLAVIQHSMNKYDAALHSIEQAIRLDHEHSSYRYWRGRVYLSLQKTQAALDDLSYAIQLNPTTPTTICGAPTSITPADELKWLCKTWIMP